MKPCKTFARATLALTAAASLAVPLAAQAQEGPWRVRVRALYLDPANKDGTGLNLSVHSKTSPELDISYFFSPQLSAELILPYPQKHTLKSGHTEIGSLKHLPPTLTAQYRFTDLGSFVPYVGAGINYTRFSSRDLPAGVTIKKSSVVQGRWPIHRKARPPPFVHGAKALAAIGRLLIRTFRESELRPSG